MSNSADHYPIQACFIDPDDVLVINDQRVDEIEFETPSGDVKVYCRDGSEFTFEYDQTIEVYA